MSDSIAEAAEFSTAALLLAASGRGFCASVVWARVYVCVAVGLS